MNKMLDEIKKAVVFIGHDQTHGKRVIRQTDSFTGTGFLLNIDNFFYLCTAKHVITELRNDYLLFPGGPRQWAAIRTASGSYKKIYFDEIKKKYSVEWVVHKTKKYDVALLPIELDQKSQEFKLIPPKLFLNQEKQDKPDELVRIFFCSFQPNLEKVKSINPIIRVGHVSRNNRDNTVLIDAQAFPGNSGSPVFIAPELGRLGEGGVQLGDDIAYKFVGVVSSNVQYMDIATSAQTNAGRILFSENTGLSNVQTYKVIEEIIKSKPFKDQLSSLKRWIADNGA
ncbi:MAG TPA: serine protease [Candidatus Babeliaceae bacterium]|nr:serine protease [Candidatus Babeliaceae bacterium]